jgi:hypothetical protein
MPPMDDFSNSLLGRFLDPARAYTAGTNANALCPTRRLDPSPLQVWIPAPLGDVVRVADVVAVSGPFPTNLTAFGHNRLPLRAKPGAVLAVPKRLRIALSWCQYLRQVENLPHSPYPCKASAGKAMQCLGRVGLTQQDETV